MKCQYESEILYKLMERDGFNIPSSVPPYESEIKSYLINQVKQAYPKLTDYEAEWLLYNYTKHLPAEFPIRSVSDVTEATFENVVPFAYQSAILRGQTLLVDEIGNGCEIPITPKITIGAWIDTDTGKEIVSDTSFYTGFLKCPTLPFIVKGNNRYKRIVFYDVNKTFISGINTTIADNSDITIDSTKIPSNAFYLRISASINPDGASYTPDTKLLIEDMSGNNLYITHLESVKMPVLTTTGKNLIPSSLIANTGLSWGSGKEYSEGSDFKFTSTEFIKIQRGVYYTSSNVKNVSHRVHCYDKNKMYLGALKTDGSIGTTTTDAYVGKKFKIDNENVRYVRLTFYGVLETAQLEQGSTSTSYEPYKSNILTVNEDVELRGIGDIRDELDLLTGEYIQRVDEVVWDGSDDERWTYNKDYNIFVYESLMYSNNYLSTNIVEKIRWNGIDRFALKPSKYGFTSHKEGMEYLKNNPITIQYQLATESIKTVDLTTVNEKGESVYFMPLEGTMNVQSSGEIIQPTFDMSVPVEATTQNLASFINLEME